MDATERIDMVHRLGSTWRFRYELVAQASPLDEPDPVNLTTRVYDCQWLDDRGSSVVVATATIVMAEAASGAIVAEVDEAAVDAAGVGDWWYYLRENNGGDFTVLASGYVTVEDNT